MIKFSSKKNSDKTSEDTFATMKDILHLHNLGDKEKIIAAELLGMLLDPSQALPGKISRKKRKVLAKLVGRLQDIPNSEPPKDEDNKTTFYKSIPKAKSILENNGLDTGPNFKSNLSDSKSDQEPSETHKKSYSRKSIKKPEVPKKSDMEILYQILKFDPKVLIQYHENNPADSTLIDTNTPVVHFTHYDDEMRAELNNPILRKRQPPPTREVLETRRKKIIDACKRHGIAHLIPEAIRLHRIQRGFYFEDEPRYNSFETEKTNEGTIYKSPDSSLSNFVLRPFITANIQSGNFEDSLVLMLDYRIKTSDKTFDDDLPYVIGKCAENAGIESLIDIDEMSNGIKRSTDPFESIEIRSLNLAHHIYEKSRPEFLSNLTKYDSIEPDLYVYLLIGIPKDTNYQNSILSIIEDIVAENLDDHFTPDVFENMIEYLNVCSDVERKVEVLDSLIDIANSNNDITSLKELVVQRYSDEPDFNWNKMAESCPLKNENNKKSLISLDENLEICKEETDVDSDCIFEELDSLVHQKRFFDLFRTIQFNRTRLSDKSTQKYVQVFLKSQRLQEDYMEDIENLAVEICSNPILYYGLEKIAPQFAITMYREEKPNELGNLVNYLHPRYRDNILNAAIGLKKVDTSVLDVCDFAAAHAEISDGQSYFMNLYQIAKRTKIKRRKQKVFESIVSKYSIQRLQVSSLALPTFLSVRSLIIMQKELEDKLEKGDINHGRIREYSDEELENLIDIYDDTRPVCVKNYGFDNAEKYFKFFTYKGIATDPQGLEQLAVVLMSEGFNDHDLKNKTTKKKAITRIKIAKKCYDLMEDPENVEGYSLNLALLLNLGLIEDIPRYMTTNVTGHLIDRYIELATEAKDNLPDNPKLHHIANYSAMQRKRKKEGRPEHVHTNVDVDFRLPLNILVEYINSNPDDKSTALSHLQRLCAFRSIEWSDLVEVEEDPDTNDVYEGNAPTKNCSKIEPIDLESITVSDRRLNECSVSIRRENITKGRDDCYTIPEDFFESENTDGLIVVLTSQEFADNFPPSEKYRAADALPEGTPNKKVWMKRYHGSWSTKSDPKKEETDYDHTIKRNAGGEKYGRRYIPQIWTEDPDNNQDGLNYIFSSGDKIRDQFKVDQLYEAAMCLADSHPDKQELVKTYREKMIEEKNEEYIFTFSNYGDTIGLKGLAKVLEK